MVSNDLEWILLKMKKKKCKWNSIHAQELQIDHNKNNKEHRRKRCHQCAKTEQLTHNSDQENKTLKHQLLCGFCPFTK